VLEIYSLEYKWRDDIMEPRAWYYCGYCHQIWIMNGKELVRAVPLTELTHESLP